MNIAVLFELSNDPLLPHFSYYILIVQVGINIFDVVAFGMSHNTLCYTVPDASFSGYCSEAVPCPMERSSSCLFPGLS